MSSLAFHPKNGGKLAYPEEKDRVAFSYCLGILLYNIIMHDIPMYGCSKIYLMILLNCFQFIIIFLKILIT
jgi:hypothetical protein